MFTEIMRQYYIENYKKPKNSKIKDPKSRKIEMPSLSILPTGYERNKMYQRLYKQQDDVKEKNLVYSKEYFIPYYNNNKEKLKEKLVCEGCNATYTRYNQGHHMKSKKHLKIVEERKDI